MPMLAQLQSRFGTAQRPVCESHLADQEILVSDIRNGLNSKAMLEAKFGKALLEEETRFIHAHSTPPRPR